MKGAFHDYEEEIELKSACEIRSELLGLLQGIRNPLSPYLVNAICNAPAFFDSLLWGVDMMLVSGEEDCLPLLDVLLVLCRSAKVKFQSSTRPEIKTILEGQDKEALKNIIIEKIKSLHQAGILEEGWVANPRKAKRDLINYIKSVTVERKEVKGRVYLGLYNSIPWPPSYKETDKGILIYRIGLELGLDLPNDEDIDVLPDREYRENGSLRQDIYHKVLSVLKTQRKRESEFSKLS